ncbi:hypothetical protein PFLUV_G00013270 [Perca fluviatilis]|uniref:Uncharacterized protein n=1 Tax=Perca fluviatilis TaxID=8168 RepID=A0A6A5FSE3_PERFL|nr:hypothetical protein PFLUV_G00013270 [Perca fluviatilis]
MFASSFQSEAWLFRLNQAHLKSIHNQAQYKKRSSSLTHCQIVFPFACAPVEAEPAWKLIYCRYLPQIPHHLKSAHVKIVSSSPFPLPVVQE